MGNGNMKQSNTNRIMKSYRVKIEDIKILDDNKIYLNQERDLVKLPPIVLKTFEKYNNFSKEKD